MMDVKLKARREHREDTREMVAPMIPQLEKLLNG